MSVRKNVSRRGFLKATGGLAGLGLAGLAGCQATGSRAGLGSAASRSRILGANDRINTAYIGCGHIAKEGHLKELAPTLLKENKLGILAACDVYGKRATEFQGIAKDAGQDLKIVRNCEEILALKDVDYVTICTPEHWHANLAMQVLSGGKHVYVEKPITHTIAEAKEVVAKVKETGLKLQVGVQGMSDDSYISAHEAILEGKLGTVVEAQIEYCRDYPLDRGPWRTGDVDFAQMATKPADLDWETWLGPAPKRAWDPHRYFEWRNYRDYSGGISTDLFVHRITRIIKACGLQFPVRVTGMGGIYIWPDGRDLPDNFEMLAEYPKIDKVTNGMTVHVLGTMANRHGIEHLIRGTKGTLIFTKGQGWELRELRTEKVLEKHEMKGGEKINLQHANLHEAIRNNKPLVCPAELGQYGLTAVAMANLSWFNKKLMTWDDKSGRAV